MKLVMRLVTSCAFLHLLLLLTAPQALPADDAHPVRHVLVLHSYNHGYLWTDEETRGISAVFSEKGGNVELHITYMDAKRLRSKETDQLISQMLAEKVKSFKFDGVILCDNDALDFASRQKDGLFKDLPAVFCGINDFADEMVSGLKNCTGVIENQDYRGSCEIGLKLFPSAKNIFVISDNSLTGKAHFEGVKKIARSVPAKFVYWNFSEHSMDKTLTQVGALGPESIILLLSFFKDGDGRTYSLEDAIGRIMEVAKAPVFTANDTRIKYGVLGGKVLTGFDQGRIAGEIMRKVLSGVPSDSIGIVKDPPLRYAFDHDALLKFKIPESTLPEGSLILGCPPPFYSVNKPLFYTIMLTIFLLLALVVALTVGIVQKKRSGEVIRESEEKFRALFEQATVGVGQADIEGTLIKVNRKYADILGYTQDEMIGMNYRKFAHPEDLDVGLANMRRLLGGEIPDFTIEARALHRNGGVVWFLLNVSLLRLKGGKEVYQIAVVQDITEKKKLEEQLVRSEKLSAVGQLVAGVAHEFNNVLMILKGNLEILKLGGASGDESAEILDILGKQVDRGCDIVSRIMAFARPKPAQKSFFRLGEMIHEVVSLQMEQMRIENISPEIDIPDTLEIYADRDQLQQVVVNMFINSRHAIYPKGTGRIRVSAAHSGNGVDIRISDDGTGMNEETKKRIFTPFFTTKGAFADNILNIKGSGLGLSVCNNIVRMHGGSISFESEEGTGTVFTIHIPDPKDIGVQGKADPAGRGLPGEFSELRILVVDDEPQICVSLSKLLCLLGCSRPRTTTSPFEAVKIASENPPDLVFLDILMSGISGLQALKQIREKHKDIFIVLMSGKLDLNIDELKAMGASGFLQKPFSKSHILDVLNSAKRNRKKA